MPSTATSILDGLSTSVAVKAPCRTVAITNITLAGLQTISGYTTVENDRVLVKGQTNPVDNGIYMASTGTWTRAKDADGNRDLVQGTRVLIRSATIDGVEYELTTANPIVIGTTELTFTLRYGANATFDQTEAEIAAGVTPTNYYKQEGNGLRYGMVGDDSTDNDAAIARLLAVATQGVKCHIPAGTYQYTDSPNWAVNGLQLSGERGTILKHTGTGVIFNMDAGADSSNSYVTGLRITDLILTGNANSTDGLFSRGVTYSLFKGLEVRSCSAKAYHIKWGVTNTYDTCIINRVVGGALSPVPQVGWYITNAGAGYYTADCTFTGCVGENFDGCTSGVGADFHDASGCTWIGGTFESLSQGLVIRADSRHNTFIGVWFEDNDTNDIVDLGTGSTFININAPSATLGPTVDVNGIGATFVGGYLRLVELASGSRATSFHGCALDSGGSVGITGTGPYTAHGCYELDTSTPGSITFSDVIPDVSGKRGNYTGTLTGVDSSQTGQIDYWVDDKGVHLETPVIEGTSNATTATITGMPEEIRPAATQRILGVVKDSGVLKVSIIQVESTGVITLFNGVSATFTSSGTKGIDAGTLPPYRLLT